MSIKTRELREIEFHLIAPGIIQPCNNYLVKTFLILIRHVYSGNTVWRQSHYTKVSEGAIFMGQNMRFGLILGRLAVRKKYFGPYASFVGGFFNIVVWVHIKKFHNIFHQLPHQMVA